MTTALPSHLATFKDNKHHYTFDVTSATVLKTSRWSDTYVSGSGSQSVGGYGGHVSGGGSMSIDSRVIQNNEVWFQIDDGGEYQYIFSGDQANVALREGQRVSFIDCRDEKGQETICGIVNHTTGIFAPLNLPVTLLPFETFWAFMGIGVIATFIAAPATIPIMIGALVMRSKAKKIRARLSAHVDNIGQQHVSSPPHRAAPVSGAAMATA